jgi:hypothetical protein
LIADTLEKTNAAGLKSVATDPDFKNAVADFNAYIRAAGSAGLKTFQLTGDPRLAVIAAYIAGEYTDKKGLVLGLKSAPVSTISDFAASKIADEIVSRTGGAGVPTVDWDAAKVGARFIMAYENGIIDSIAPKGIALTGITGTSPTPSPTSSVTSSPARGVNVNVAPSGQTKDLSDVRKDVLRLRKPGI